jgi:hypothetical protein
MPSHDEFVTMSSLLTSLLDESDTCARLTQIGTMQRTFQGLMKGCIFHCADTSYIIDHLQESIQQFLSLLHTDSHAEREKVVEMMRTLQFLMKMLERAVTSDARDAYGPYGNPEIPNFFDRIASRKKAVEELVITEKNYLAQLTELDELFISPLRNEIENDRTPTVDKKSFDGMFSIVTIILKIVQDHYPAMEEVLSQKGNPIGAVFLKICPWFKHYTVYIYHFDESARKIQDLRKKNSKLGKFFRDAEKKSTINYDLSSYMILPVQRLGRYEMLLKRILEFTPRTHSDYLPVKSALSNVFEINRQINEYKRADENRKLIENLSKKFAVTPKPPLDVIQTILVCDGPAHVCSGKGVPQKPSRISHVILFQDSLMICKVNSDGKIEKKLSFALSNCRIIEHEHSKDGDFVIALLDGAKTPHFFFFESAKVRDNWSKKLRELLEHTE